MILESLDTYASLFNAAKTLKGAPQDNQLWLNLQNALEEAEADLKELEIQQSNTRLDEINGLPDLIGTVADIIEGAKVRTAFFSKARNSGLKPHPSTYYQESAAWWIMRRNDLKYYYLGKEVNQ